VEADSMKVGDIVELSGELWAIAKIATDRKLCRYIKVRTPTDAERVGARMLGVAYSSKSVVVGTKRIYLWGENGVLSYNPDIFTAMHKKMNFWMYGDGSGNLRAGNGH
jgi:hypothetical protein